MNRKLQQRMTLPLIAACLVLADCSSNTSSSPGPTTAFAVMRFTSAGVLDTTFAGGSGVAITDIDTGLFDFALAAAVQPDDSIIAGGSSGLAGQGVVALVRYDKFGALDPGFGSGGIVRTPAPAGSNAASASAIAVLPGGKILVAALTFTASSNTTGIALIRYNANGTLDTTFGAAATGIVTAAIGQGLASDTCGLALQSDGKIVVAGADQSGNIVLYRYNANGTLDTTGFGTTGTGGSTTTNLGAGTAAMSPALALQSSGKIVLVSGTNSDQVVIRYNTNGTLDNTTFGTTQTVPGIVVTDAGGIDFANSVAIMQDGSDKIVVAGHANVNFQTDASDISLVRYTVDGALDTTFGPANTGIVTTDLFGKFDNAFSVALQSPAATNTAILVSGNTGSGGFSQAVVLRYDSTGALDTTFSQPFGYAIPPLFGPSNIASGNAVVLQSTLGIIVAGYD